MRTMIFLLSLFCFGNNLFAQDCSLSGLDKNQKQEVYEKIKENLEIGFENFFIEKGIKLNDWEIRIDFVDNDLYDLEGKTYLVDLFFIGKTEKSIIRNRVSKKEYNLAYILDFSLLEERDSEGIPGKKYCQVWGWGEEVKMYNNSFDDFFIGSFYSPTGVISRF